MATCWILSLLLASNPVDDIAARIDARVNERLQAEGVTPAPTCDDAEFVRRAYLHLAGVIPTAGETRTFLVDSRPEKRRELIERGLSGPGYIMHFTTVWRHVLIPETENDLQLRGLQPAFDAWLRERLASGARYDELVRELLTADLRMAQGGNVFGGPSTASPSAFFLAKDVKAENLAAATARAFLGVRLDCAQCHDHPFDTWKRDDFWGFAAFYAGFVQANGPNPAAGGIREFRDRRELTIPQTSQVRQARFLTGDLPDWQPRATSRETLAAWITSAENPWFAKAAVNRVWAHLFGIGLVDPPDDFSSANPPSHPELLDELAESFIATNYDLPLLLQGIMASKTYQRTSRMTDDTQQDPRLFARLPVQALNAEEIAACLNTALGLPAEPLDQGIFGMQRDPQLANTFAASIEAPTERHKTILQALLMMNGARTNQPAPVLRAITEFPGLSVEERIESLFFATLSRPPTAEEAKIFATHVQSVSSNNAESNGLADVLWTLLNSAEFLTIH